MGDSAVDTVDKTRDLNDNHVHVKIKDASEPPGMLNLSSLAEIFLKIIFLLRLLSQLKNKQNIKNFWKSNILLLNIPIRTTTQYTGI